MAKVYFHSTEIDSNGHYITTYDSTWCKKHPDQKTQPNWCKKCSQDLIRARKQNQREVTIP